MQWYLILKCDFKLI